MTQSAKSSATRFEFSSSRNRRYSYTSPQASDMEAVTHFLQGTTRCKPLTAVQELVLGTCLSSASPDIKARITDILFRHNLRLVANIAMGFVGRGVPLADLLQEGGIGLLRAISKFDYQRGNRFSTMAYHWIRQAISRALDNDSRTIRLPARVNNDIRIVSRERNEYYQTYGEWPSMDKLSELSHIPMDRVIIACSPRCVKEIASLDIAVDADERDLYSCIVDENCTDPVDVVTDSSRLDTIRHIMSLLSDKEYRVVALRYGFDGGHCRTLEECGKELGVTRERARQYQKQAEEKLREAAIAAGLF